MSSQPPDPQVDHLLRDGIQAARDGDKGKARTLLEQVVERDQYNEAAWFWLAAVTDSDEEKRICLGNVIVINPNNQRAQHLLDQIEKRQASAKPGSTPPAGVNRKLVYVAIGLGVMALLALVVLLVVVSRGDENTPAASVDGGTPATVSSQLAAAATATPLPVDFTPSPTRTPVPTWTPSPTRTPMITATPLAALPANLSLPGWLIMQSGRSMDGENYPIVVMRPNGTDRRVITPDSASGRMPILSPDGTLYAYVFTNAVPETILQVSDLQNSAPKGINKRWGGVPALTDFRDPAWSADGQWMVFTAVDLATQTRDLYLVAMSGADDNPDNLKALTDDDLSEAGPAFSPDGEFIVYSAETDPQDGPVITELYLYNIESGTSSLLTRNGAELVERNPDWAPNGDVIVFEGYESGGAASDLYLIPATIGGEVEKIEELASDAAETRPRYSPDGRYLLFSSNRLGNWDVFIFDLTMQELYQITTDSWTDVANDWSG